MPVNGSRDRSFTLWRCTSPVPCIEGSTNACSLTTPEAGPRKRSARCWMCHLLFMNVLTQCTHVVQWRKPIVSRVGMGPDNNRNIAKPVSIGIPTSQALSGGPYESD